MIDECLSPSLVKEAEALGFAAAHIRDRGRLSFKDHEIAKWCFDHDLVLVTHNATDFRKLLGSAEVQPGLIVLQANALDGSRKQIKLALQHIEAVSADDSARYMINRIVFVDHAGSILDQELPATE